MTPEKREMAKSDLFAFYIGRPLSYYLTIPFLSMNVRPNQISLFSIIEVCGAALLLSLTNDRFWAFIAVFLFFLWNLLDGVDGNIARVTKIHSKMGSTWDAASGYAATVLTYFSMGVYATNVTDSSVFIILGGLSGIFTLYPRLVMHKSKDESDVARNSLANKKEYGVAKIIVLNFSSTTGFVQPLMLCSILFNLSDLFTICYFLLNLLLMLVSLRTIFKGTL